MHYLRAVAMLLCASPAFAALETPPAVGEAVHVAASFKGIQHPKLVSGAAMNYDMSPCKKLVVKKINAKKRVWTVEDPLGNQERLEGAWLPFMFKTEGECKSYTSTQGEANVVKSGMTFKVVEADTGAEN